MPCIHARKNQGDAPVATETMEGELIAIDAQIRSV
jgi:hypothetical protein